MGTTCLDAVAFVERLKASFRDSTPATSSFLRNHLSLWPKHRSALLHWKTHVLQQTPERAICSDYRIHSAGCFSMSAANGVFSARWSEILNLVSNLVDGWCESESSLSNSNSNQATKDDVEYIRFRPAQQCFFCFVLKLSTIHFKLPLNSKLSTLN